MGPTELARLTGVSADTLRHYERKKVLPPPARSAAGYRRYGPGAVERVRLVRRALVVGFSLDELARVFGERDRGGAPCRQVRALVGERLLEVEQRLKDLATLRRELRALVSDWDRRLAATPAGARAHLLESLAGDHQGVSAPRMTRRFPPRRR